MPILYNKFAKLLHNGIQYRRVYKGDKIIVNTMMDAEYFSKAAEFIFDLTKGTSNTINLYDRWKATELEEIAEITANFAKTNPYITDWGDGTQDFLLTHTYKQPGSYTVKTFYHINNVVDGSAVYDEDTVTCLTHVNKIVNINYTDTSYMFNNCTSITSLDLSSLDTNNVTEFANMFTNVPEISVLGWKYDETNYTNFTLTEEETNYVGNIGKFPWNCFVLEFKPSKVSGNYYVSGQLPSIFIDSEFKTATANYTVVKLESGELSNDIENISIYSMPNIKVYYPKETSRISFSGKLIYRLISINTSNLTSMSHMFYNCKSLTSLDVSDWDTSSVTNMSYMFYYCEKLTELNLSTWDTSNVTDMSCMFKYCEKLDSLDLTGWDTSSVTNMSEMFRYNRNGIEYLDLSHFDTSNVTDMSCMFEECKKLEEVANISNWNTSNVTNMSSLFNGCTNLKRANLSNWDTSKVTNMSSLFYECKSLISLDLSSWDTRNITNSYGIFMQIPNLRISGWNYDGANYSNWTLTENQTLYRYTFPWNMTYEVKYTLVENTLTDAISTHLPTFTEITDTTADNAKVYRLTLVDGTKTNDLATEMQNVSKVEILYDNAAYNSISFSELNQVESIEKLNVNSYWTNMSNMFNGCSSLSTINGISEWDTSNVTNMSQIFIYCTSLSVLDISKWNTSNVTALSNTFHGCTSLTSIDVSTWNTSKITNMNGLFQNCQLITSLDLSNWDVSEVTTAYSMFSGCTSLTSIDVSTWYTNKLNIYSEMFSSCQKSCIGYYGPTLWTLPQSGSDFNITWVAPYNVYDIDLQYLDNTTVELYPYEDIPQFTIWGDGTYDKLTTHTYDTANGTELTIYTKLFHAEETEPPSVIAEYIMYNDTNVLPTFNAEFTDYTITDVDNGDGTTTRIISSYDLPTSFYFFTDDLIAVKYLNTSNVTSMRRMFDECLNLTYLDLSGCDISKVTDTYDMVSECSSIESINLSTWDTSNITNSTKMLSGLLSSVVKEWFYDGSNYINWGLTETDVGYRGTFPWNENN